VLQNDDRSSSCETAAVCQWHLGCSRPFQGGRAETISAKCACFIVGLVGAWWVALAAWIVIMALRYRLAQLLAFSVQPATLHSFLPQPVNHSLPQANHPSKHKHRGAGAWLMAGTLKPVVTSTQTGCGRACWGEEALLANSRGKLSEETERLVLHCCV
jgi:hypothetical protein